MCAESTGRSVGVGVIVENNQHVVCTIVIEHRVKLNFKPVVRTGIVEVDHSGIYEFELNVVGAGQDP